MDRFSAWNFRGRACPACSFPGTLLYTETCVVCGLSLLDCPKCRHVECTGSGRSCSGVRGESEPKDLATGLKIVTKAERRRLAAILSVDDTHGKGNHFK